MNILIITAHPSTKGFTHAIAQSYMKGAKEKGMDVEMLNLYDKENHQNFLVYEEQSKIPEDKNREIFQKKITWADELVFVFPIWWGGMPSIMRNFLDMNLTHGFAFKFENGKEIGLLTSKKYRIFTTCDAPGFFYKMLFLPLQLKGFFKYYIFGYCGIKMTSFDLFDVMRKRDENNRKNILEKVYNIAKK